MLRILNQYVPRKLIYLVTTEVFLISLSVLCAARLRFWNDDASFQDYTILPDFAIQSLVVVVVFQLCFYYNDLYNLTAVRGRSELVVRIGEALGAGCLLLGLLYFLIPSLLMGRGVFFIGMALTAGSVAVIRVMLDSLWTMGGFAQKVVIIGTGQLAQTVAREIARRDDLHVAVTGFIAGQGSDIPRDDKLFGRPVFGSTSDLSAIVTATQASKIVVALEDYRGSLPTRELVRLRVEGVEVEDAHSLLASLSGSVWLESVRPSWFVFSSGFHRSRANLILKRIIDVLLAAIGLVLSAPLMVLVAVASRLDSEGPVIYEQRRVGLRGRCFELLKFRSMRADAEKEGAPQWASQDDPRITRAGKFWRLYRLDELPQFLNVLRGEMSFVGPRPERPEFVEMLRQRIPFYDERHTVRPGITGWAQVQYRYGSSVDDAVRKLEFDLFYLQHMSVLLDFLIIVKTVRIVLLGHGR